MARRARGGRRGEIARAIPEEFGAETADEAQEAPRQILGPTMEAMLRAELDAHLGYASNGRSPKATANRRDGYTPKRARTSAGELEISVPRDRDGSFEPVYAFMFVDCLHVPARDGRGARDAAVCAVPAYDLRGRKDVPGPWVGDPEGAHRWMRAFDELRARGAEDVLHVSSDGVAGLGGAGGGLPGGDPPALRHPPGPQLAEVRPAEGGRGVLPLHTRGLRRAVAGVRRVGVGRLPRGAVAPPARRRGVGAQP